ncbi:MAG: LCP family protein [Actinobacteria bacterium]|nr:LCP family protein [Actinomycetota bacterium]
MVDHPHPHARRTFLAGAASVSAFIAIVAAVSMGTYFWARGQINVIPDPPEGEATEAAEPDIAGVCDERACNYLLLGSDSREGLTPQEQVAFGTDEDIGGENRSDTIILVHTEPDQRQATFLSFPRDLWVDIPGVGEGRINSAFEGGIDGGGAQRVARTVKQLTGLRINHVLYVDLAGFQGLVDALDGVDMCVPYPMQDELTGLDIPAGCQHFDGSTALAYVRTRHQPCDTIPDFARIGRQQQFMRAVVSRLLSPGELLRLPTLVPELLDNLVVDEGLRNPAELVYLAGTLDGVNTGAADFRSVPSTPAGTYVNGEYLSIVNTTEPQATQLFERIKAGKPLGDLGRQLASIPPTPANIVVTVVDMGAGFVATDMLGVLTDGGFDTSPGVVGRADVRSPVKGSAIVYREGFEPEAKVVGTYFRDLPLVAAPAGVLPAGVDVAVVATATYQIPPPSTEAPVECP